MIVYKYNQVSNILYTMPLKIQILSIELKNYAIKNIIGMVTQLKHYKSKFYLNNLVF